MQEAAWQGVVELGHGAVQAVQREGWQQYGLPVIGRCNYRPVITAVITVITTALFQLPVIGQDKPSVRVPSPADTRAAARQSHLQGHVTEEMALTAPR